MVDPVAERVLWAFGASDAATRRVLALLVKCIVVLAGNGLASLQSAVVGTSSAVGIALGTLESMAMASLVDHVGVVKSGHVVCCPCSTLGYSRKKRPGPLGGRPECGIPLRRTVVLQRSAISC